MQENCRVELPIGKNGKELNAFARTPKYILKKLMKLHRINLHNKKIITEVAASSRIKRIISKTYSKVGQ